MDTSVQNNNVALPVLKRVFGLGVSGGVLTALVGAVLNGLVNALLAMRAPDWQSFSFVVGTSFVVGGIISLLFGTIAFGVAGALLPHPKGSSVFRFLCRQTLLGMAAGSLLGLLCGIPLVVIVNMALSMNKNAPFAIVLNYADSITVALGFVA